MKKKIPINVEVVEVKDHNGFPYWIYKKPPKELIPTEASIGKLVTIAKEPGSRDKYKDYRIVKLVTSKQGDVQVEVHGPEGWRCFSIESVILGKKSLTKEEELIKEHESK